MAGSPLGGKTPPKLRLPHRRGERGMEKKAYSAPKLITYGTVKDITGMPEKIPGGGDGKDEQPFGKVPGAADSMDQHSRS